MRLADLDYRLSSDRIAQHPPEVRDAARLLILRGGEMEHGRVLDLPALLPPRTLLIINDTKVVPARLMARKPTGASIELLLIEPEETGDGFSVWRCLARPAKRLRPGGRLEAGGEVMVVVGPARDGTVLVRFEKGSDAVLDFLMASGQVPLPPYIARSPEPVDAQRYQTVYAEVPGAVAAPTAGLHFTPALLSAIRGCGHEVASVTLHVGPGTFRPIATEVVSEHRMDAEWYRIPGTTARAIETARSEGRTVLAVGTTVVRALESAARAGSGRILAGEARTELFIMPGFEFRIVNALLTNFHLPRSTLLCLVYAFAGRHRVRSAYDEAIRAGYRFYSYGDAMLIV